MILGLATSRRNADGLTQLADICIGTNVGDLPFYLARPRAANDLHGLGAFLIMNEEFERLGGLAAVQRRAAPAAAP